MINFQKYQEKLKQEPVISKKFFKNILDNIQTEYVRDATDNGCVINVGKVYKPPYIQKYDVITASVCGSLHPCIVIAVKEGYVYSVCLSTTKADHNTFTFERSRLFKGSYMTNTIIRHTPENALSHFVGIFDNIPEAEQGFAVLKEIYKGIFEI